MPYSVPLSATLRKAGWRAKIYDAEGPEEPHVSIFKRGRKWRVSLRSGTFLDDGDKWGQIDDNVKGAIEANWQTLRSEWDRLHGAHNPIASEPKE